MEQYEFKICVTAEEEEECIRLYQQSYLNAGHIVPRCDDCDYSVCCGGLSTCKLLIWTEFHQSDASVIWKAVDVDGRLLATATAVFDSEIGVPCEKTFPTEVAIIRCFETLGEMCCLAAVGKGRVMPRLLRHVRDWMWNHVRVVVGCCHPHHREFWERVMGATFPQQDVKKAKHASEQPAVFGFRRRVER